MLRLVLRLGSSLLRTVVWVVRLACDVVPKCVYRLLVPLCRVPNLGLIEPHSPLVSTLLCLSVCGTCSLMGGTAADLVPTLSTEYLRNPVKEYGRIYRTHGSRARGETGK